MTTAAVVDVTGHERVPQSIRLWTALSLTTFLLGIVFWIGFTTVGGVFFTLSDGVALLMAATMIPVMVGYDRMLRSPAGARSAAARSIGVVGMVIAAAGSIVLLSSEVTHEFIPAEGGLGMQLIGFGLEGVWFILVGWMANRSGLFGRGLGITCVVTGVGFLMGVPGSVLGPESIWVVAGGALSFFGFVLWALRSRRVLTDSGAV